MSISIIIPVYNEAECIKLCVEETQRAFRDVDYEILIVNDGSTDQSQKIISALASGNGHIQYLSYPKNKGYSHAIRRGIQLASKEYTSYLDADLQYLPTELRKMYEFAVKNQYAFVLGKPTRKYYKFLRHFMSFVYNFLVAQLLNLRVGDANSLKLIATQTLKALELKREFGGVELEILMGIVEQAIPITVFPIRVQERFAGKSKANLKLVFSTLHNILDLRSSRKEKRREAQSK